MRGGVRGNLSPTNSPRAKIDISTAQVVVPTNQNGDPASGVQPHIAIQLTSAIGVNARRPEAKPIPNATKNTNGPLMSGSDLLKAQLPMRQSCRSAYRHLVMNPYAKPDEHKVGARQIGRASCRERV